MKRSVMYLEGGDSNYYTCLVFLLNIINIARQSSRRGSKSMNNGRASWVRERVLHDSHTVLVGEKRFRTGLAYLNHVSKSALES